MNTAATQDKPETLYTIMGVGPDVVYVHMERIEGEDRITLANCIIPKEMMRDILEVEGDDFKIGKRFLLC